MVKQPEDQFDEQDYYISCDPLRDGNCQFSSICRILREFDLQRIWIFIWMSHSATA